MKRAAIILAAMALPGWSLVTGHPAAAQYLNQQPRLVDVPGLGTVYVLEVVDADPRALPRIVQVPGYGDVYIIPVRPRDTRTARQACIEEETAKVGGAPSRLELRAIDLKCSQR
jgi:hypothetical protein